MQQVKSPILCFFFLILGIPLNFYLDVSYKQDGFPKTLPKKSLKFVLSRRNGTVMFNLNLKLLPAKIDFIPKKQNRKKMRLGPMVLAVSK